MTKKRIITIAVAVLAVILLISLFGKDDPEDVAEKFVKSMLEGDAKEFVSLLSEETIDSIGAQSKKILISKTEDTLEDMLERYEDKYGSSWDYDITVIDSYEGDNEDTVEVYIKVEHEGGGWLNDKSGEETLTVTVIKEDGDWRILDYSK